MRAFRPSFRKLVNVCCNDAVGTAHRACSSIVSEGFETKCSGGLVSKELDAFAKVLDEATLGGAKVRNHVQMITKEIPKYRLQGKEIIVEMPQVRVSEVIRQVPLTRIQEVNQRATSSRTSPLKPLCGAPPGLRL